MLAICVAYKNAYMWLHLRHSVPSGFASVVDGGSFGVSKMAWSFRWSACAGKLLSAVLGWWAMWVVCVRVFILYTVFNKLHVFVVNLVELCFLASLPFNVSRVRALQAVLWIIVVSKVCFPDAGDDVVGVTKVCIDGSPG